MHAVAQEVESFLDKYGVDLPPVFGKFRTHRDFWRAFLLTGPDQPNRVPVQDLGMYPKGNIWGPEFLALMDKGWMWTMRLKHRLSLRTDSERVRVQRPLTGRSLLAVTTCQSLRYAQSLRSLVVMGIHPMYGVEGYRTTDFTEGSFALPGALKERLTRLGSGTDGNNMEDVEEDFVQKASKMTAFVQSLFAARDWIRSGKRGRKLEVFVQFLHQAGLVDDDAWASLGDLPAHFIPADHGFVVKVPYVAPGTQMILWNTWFTNAGRTNADLAVASSIDLTPVSFLDKDELAWYRYLNQSAPVDLSATGGGAYRTLVSKVREEATTYGLPDEYLEMFDNGLRHMATDADNYHGLGMLTETQKTTFHQQGYLVVDIPALLVNRLPVDKSLGNLERFQKVVVEGCPRYSEKDPLNPFVRLPKMKILSYPLEPFHLAFQYTSFLHNLLASFYQPGRIEPLLVVQEPFQQRTTTTTWSSFRVNNCSVNLIPFSHRQYRAQRGLCTF
jgi:hypothetical protein